MKPVKIKPLIIIGSGTAGYAVARELRKLNRTMPITIICQDSGDAYAKPMLSNAFLLGKTAASLVNFTAQQMAQQLDVRVMPHTTVTAIDTGAHTVSIQTVEGEARFSYASLVLALGADQRRLALAGDGAGDVLTVNDLDDYARFRSALDGCQRVAILGAGLIGCEFANDLANGYQVALIDPAKWPLSRLLPEPQGHAMAVALRGIGVTLHFGQTPHAIERHGRAYRIYLADGTVLEADRVLASTGLLPRTALARAAGIAVERGIVTDGWLRTSAADVYALGDCAEINGEVLPYIMPIMLAARSLASTLAGAPARVQYPVMPVQVKTPALPAVVAAPPPLLPGYWQAAARAAPTHAANGVWEFRDEANALHGFALIGEHVKEKAALLKTMPPAWA